MRTHPRNHARQRNHRRGSWGDGLALLACAWAFAHGTASAAAVYEVRLLPPIAKSNLPEQNYPRAYAINSSGMVVGQGYVANGTSGGNHVVAWAPPGYLPTSLGTLMGGKDAYASDINDAGFLVGVSNGVESGTPFSYHAFLREPGNPNMIDLGLPLAAPWATDAFAWAVSQAVGGQLFVAGHVQGEDRWVAPGDAFESTRTKGQGFVWRLSDKTMELLGPGKLLHGDDLSVTADVNASGRVVGFGGNSMVGGPYHGFFYDWGSSTVTDIPATGYLTTQPRAINDAGWIAGVTYTGPNLPPVAFRWDSKGSAANVEELGLLPGCAWSMAYDINAKGEIVGASGEPKGGNRAFFWSQGDGMKDLNDLLDASTKSKLNGQVLEWAKAINDHGQIIAFARSSAKDPLIQSSFLLTPIPTVQGKAGPSTGSLQLEWNLGKLESSPNPQGPWTLVPNATSPHVVVPEQGVPSLFFRARVGP